MPEGAASRSRAEFVPEAGGRARGSTARGTSTTGVPPKLEFCRCERIAERGDLVEVRAISRVGRRVVGCEAGVWIEERAERREPPVIIGHEQRRGRHRLEVEFAVNAPEERDQKAEQELWVGEAGAGER